MVYVVAILSLMAGAMVMAGVRLSSSSRGWFYDGLDGVYYGNYGTVSFVVSWDEDCGRVYVVGVPESVPVKNVSGLERVEGYGAGGLTGMIGRGVSRVGVEMEWEGSGIEFSVVDCLDSGGESYDLRGDIFGGGLLVVLLFGGMCGVSCGTVWYARRV